MRSRRKKKQSCGTWMDPSRGGVLRPPEVAPSQKPSLVFEALKSEPKNPVAHVKHNSEIADVVPEEVALATAASTTLEAIKLRIEELREGYSDLDAEDGLIGALHYEYEVLVRAALTRHVGGGDGLEDATLLLQYAIELKVRLEEVATLLESLRLCS